MGLRIKPQENRHKDEAAANANECSNTADEDPEQEEQDKCHEGATLYPATAGRFFCQKYTPSPTTKSPTAISWL